MLYVTAQITARRKDPSECLYLVWGSRENTPPQELVSIDIICTVVPWFKGYVSQAQAFTPGRRELIYMGSPINGAKRQLPSCYPGVNARARKSRMSKSGDYLFAW